MNKLEHYVIEVYSVIDVTAEYIKYAGWRGKSTPIVKVEMLVDCCGIRTVATEVFSSIEWEQVKMQGFYLG